MVVDFFLTILAHGEEASVAVSIIVHFPMINDRPIQLDEIPYAPGVSPPDVCVLNVVPPALTRSGLRLLRWGYYIRANAGIEGER